MQDELSTKYSEKLTYKALYDMSSIISSLRSEEIGAMILESDMASIYAKDLDDVLKISGFKLKNVSTEQEKDIFTIYISYPVNIISMICFINYISNSFFYIRSICD